MAATYRKKTEKTTSHTALPEIPLNLNSGHVENRSQNEVELEPELDPKSDDMKVRSPPEMPELEMILDSDDGADKDAKAEGAATATKLVPENEKKKNLILFFEMLKAIF